MPYPFSPIRLTAFLTALLLPVVTAADLVVLQYHHIAEDTPWATSTSPALFRAQLDRIADLGIKVVPLEEATEQVLEGGDDPQPMVALTFDDAYSSVYEAAWPILKTRGLPFTVFVNTQAIEQGTPGYMSWAQLHELSGSDLVTIGNHSSDHAHLVAGPGESPAALERRIAASLDDATASLRDNLDLEPRLFAYPYGEYSMAAEELVKDREWLGYGQQSGPVGKGSVATALPRFPASNAYGALEGLTDKLRSLAFPFEAAALPPAPITTNPPELVLTLPDSWKWQRLSCFASGQGRINVVALKSHQVRVQAGKAFDGRRARYNCTYPAADGRFYWLSQAWINAQKPES